MTRSIEEAIERFVRYPESLDPAEREATARRIETDVAARHLASFYASFYEELDATPGPASLDAGGPPPESGGASPDSGPPP